MKCRAVHSKAYFHVSTDGEENNVLLIWLEQIIYEELVYTVRQYVCSVRVCACCVSLYVCLCVCVCI